jgi:N-acetylmuramic acid 6-phosphate (MurNAc-6-P) etherase
MRGLRAWLRARSLVDHEIVVVVGPGFIAGSARLRPDRLKLVLNAISTSP